MAEIYFYGENISTGEKVHWPLMSDVISVISCLVSPKHTLHYGMRGLILLCLHFVVTDNKSRLVTIKDMTDLLIYCGRVDLLCQNETYHPSLCLLHQATALFIFDLCDVFVMWRNQEGQTVRNTYCMDEWCQ